MAALMPNGISVSATSTNSFQTMAMKLDYSVCLSTLKRAEQIIGPRDERSTN